MNTDADDLATLVDELDLSSVMHIGRSTGGGEVVRYIGRHGTERDSAKSRSDTTRPHAFSDIERRE